MKRLFLVYRDGPKAGVYRPLALCPSRRDADRIAKSHQSIWVQVIELKPSNLDKADLAVLVVPLLKMMAKRLETHLL